MPKVLRRDFPVVIDYAPHERIFQTWSFGSFTTCSPRWKRPLEASNRSFSCGRLPPYLEEDSGACFRHHSCLPSLVRHPKDASCSRYPSSLECHANASKRPSACDNHHGRPQGAGDPYSTHIRARSGSAGNSRCSRSGAPAPKEARKHRVKNL